MEELPDIGTILILDEEGEARAGIDVVEPTVMRAEGCVGFASKFSRWAGWPTFWFEVVDEEKLIGANAALWVSVEAESSTDH